VQEIPHVCGVGLVNTTRAKSTIVSYKGQGAQTGGRSHRLEPVFTKAVACEPPHTLSCCMFFPYLHQSTGQRISHTVEDVGQLGERCHGGKACGGHDSQCP
jgi:hypothetical protein